MIGILNAYHFDTTPGNYQEEYFPMIEEYLRKAFPNEEIKNYLVAQGEFPKDVFECDAWIITGSPCSCYDDLPWIKKLSSIIKDCHTHKAKLLGICFGHQLIAQALGGKVEKSPKGWGVGIRSFDVLDYHEFMDETLQGDQCSLIFSHQDQVIKLPRDAKHLGKDSFCENQMYCIDKHIFCVQGHPEFSLGFATRLYMSRTDRIGESLVKKALATMSNSTDEDKVLIWIKNFFESY